ncbi:MAG: hypothetical protein ACT4P9_10545 [Betaproteobacteria bacterium]
MNFTAQEWKKLAAPVALALALLAAGAGLIWHAQMVLRKDSQNLVAARTERVQARERLSKIAEEEREVKANIEVYQQLKSLGILGEERRLEWVDAMARIRASRELLDLKYSVERQKLSHSVAGKPANVDFYSSTMKVDLALLHEGDLLGFLADLRASGNAYFSVQKCTITRTGQSASGANLVPRLRASCAVDLITILDRAAKA